MMLKNLLKSQDFWFEIDTTKKGKNFLIDVDNFLHVENAFETFSAAYLVAFEFNQVIFEDSVSRLKSTVSISRRKKL